MRGKQSESGKHRKGKNGKGAVIVINDQVVKLAKAVGGGPGSRASNRGMNNKQKESARMKARRKAKAARKRQTRPKKRR